MNQMAKENDPISYSENFSAAITGSRYLVYRDVPELFKKYSKNAVTLDYGCGPGESSIFLKSLGLEVEGMDINEHMINLAKQKDPSGKYQVIASGNIPREDNYYDNVVVAGVLTHVSTKDELNKICREIARVLKVGGTLIAIVSSEEMYNNNEWVSADTRFEENRNLKSGSVVKYLYKETNYLFHLYYWSEKDHSDVITNAGLTVIDIHRPLGTDTDGYEWISEKEKPYASIFVAQKFETTND